MKKRELFKYFLIGLFIFILCAYAFNTIENQFIKTVDVINENLEAKDILFIQETKEDDEMRGKYLTNDGTIYTYNYVSYGDKTFEEKLDNIKNSTANKVEKISKKDKGYLNLFVKKYKEKYYTRSVKTDRPSRYIYFVNYDKNEFMILLSSGKEVIKNKGIASSRTISVLKKYSIRVD